MANINQKRSPYGPVKFSSIDEYHASFPREIEEKLEQLRQIITEAAPEVTECISYNMPAFRKNTVLVYYAAAKNHIGFYPTPKPIAIFKDELSKYKTSKGAIQFSLNDPLPKELIQKIVRFRLEDDQR